MTIIRPTVFIGLGTTGANILCKLQEFIFAEYQTSNFPIISLVSFVTAQGDAKFSKLFPVEEVFLSIPDMNIIKDNLNDPKNEKDKLLKHWIPQSLFTHSDFTNGSKNIRPAGKLQLWSNFEKVYEVIQESIDNVIDANSKKECENLLENFLGAKNSQIAGKANVVVVGALGGGTCSGVAPELGYLIKDIALNKAEKVLGVFTIPENRQAKFPTNELQTFCANSYTALQELNYHYWNDVKKRKFDQFLPNGTLVTGKPYDYVYLESIENSEEASFSNDPKGLKALEEMIALNLSIDLCSGVGDIKESTRSNFGGFKTQNGDVYGMPDTRDGYPHSFHSFGASAIVYPKFRLARAVAAKIAQNSFHNLQSDTSVEGEKSSIEISNLIKLKLSDIIKIIREKTSQIISNIDSEIASASTSHPDFDTSRGTDFLERIIMSLPRKDTEKYKNKIAEGGTFEKELRQRMEQIQPEIEKKVLEFSQEIQKDCQRFPEIMKRWDSFIAGIDKIISNKPSGNPTLAFSELEYSIGKLIEVEQDKLLTVLFLKKEAISERKKQILQNFRQILVRAFKNLRSKLGAEMLEKVKKEYINKSLKPKKDLEYSKNRLSLLENNLKKILDDLVTTLVKPPQNIRFVYRDGIVEQGDDSWAEKEITNLHKLFVDKFSDTNIKSALVRGINYTIGQEVEPESFNDELQKAVDDEDYFKLVSRLLDWLTKEVLKELQNEPETHISKLLAKVKNKIQPDLVEISKSGSFYINFDSKYYQGKNRCISSQAIFNIFHPKNINASILNSIPNVRDVKWKPEEVQGMDHQVIFSTEEAGFTTSLMPAWEHFHKHYKTEQKTSDLELLWTDKRWATTENEIDFSRSSRMQYLEFLLEGTVFVIGDDLCDANKLSYISKRSSGNLYFEVPKEGDFDAFRISLGNEDHYRDASSKTKFDRINKFIKERFNACTSFMGLENIEEVAENLLRDLEGKVEELKGNAEKAKEIPKLENDLIKVKMFRGYVRKEVFDKSYTQDEENLLNNYFQFLRNVR